MIQHEIDKALALADDIELHGHPETLCTKAAMLIRKLISEVKVESTQYEFEFKPKNNLKKEGIVGQYWCTTDMICKPIREDTSVNASQGSENWTNSDGS